MASVLGEESIEKRNMSWIWKAVKVVVGGVLIKSCEYGPTTKAAEATYAKMCPWVDWAFDS